MKTFEAEPVRGPEREVVEPDEPIDRTAGVAVIPGGVAGEPAKNPPARVLDSEDADAVESSTKREGTLPNPVVYRLEERLREPVHGHVQQAARASLLCVSGDEE